MVHITDQLGRDVVLEQSPKRIISLVPSLTELIVDLGLENKIVGCTKFCVHPHHMITPVTVVGGTKQVHYDRVKSLQPDIILANKEENTAAMVTELEKIAPVYVSDINTLEQAYQCFRDYGLLFHVQEKVTRLITDIKNGFASIPKITGSKRVAYLIWQRPFMAVGGDTYINTILGELGFQNAFDQDIIKGRYPEVALKDLQKVDIILLSTEPFPFKENHVIELQDRTGKQVMLVDGEYFSWYGSRMLKAIPYFKKLLSEVEKL